MKIENPHEGILVIDDFLTAPNAVRAHALLSEYIDWRGPDGEVYKRVSLLRVPGVTEALQELLGPIEMLGMAYRLNYQGELPNQSIHTDLGWGTHALTLYLSEGESGTAFWKHKETGELLFRPGNLELFETLSKDWEDETKWDKYYTADLKFNRAVLYDSSLFHSRYPFESFGDNPENGRLIAVAFFICPQGLPEVSDDSEG